jgi:rhodanese-related sulfurtransferase
LIYCYHGNASQNWAQMFADFGFTDVCDLIGGHAAVAPRTA